MEKTRVFADGMESVSLTDGMIRCELYCVTPLRDAGKTAVPPEHDVFGELLMTPQSFIRAYGAMEDLIRQLTEAGIVKRSANPTPKDAPAASTVSPNFG
ncbi:MAG: hypothetical protein PHS41_02915 [Victivallaceae bacterium]|nr:hypothetical protein [Victivallaceae bacterium]